MRPTAGLADDARTQLMERRGGAISTESVRLDCETCFSTIRTPGQATLLAARRMSGLHCRSCQLYPEKFSDRSNQMALGVVPAAKIVRSLQCNECSAWSLNVSPSLALFHR